MAKELIGNYLSARAPECALTIFLALTESKQTQFKELEVKFSDIYHAYGHKGHIHRELLRLTKACLGLLEKLKQTTKQNIPCLPLIEALRHNLFINESLELLDAAQKKGLLTSDQIAKVRSRNSSTVILHE